MDAKGQSTIEAALALPVIVAILTAMAAIAYRASIYFWTDYHLHEAIICLDSQSRRTCEDYLNARIKKALLFEEDLETKLQSHRKKISGEVRIGLKPKLFLKQTRYEK